MKQNQRYIIAGVIDDLIDIKDGDNGKYVHSMDKHMP